MGTEYLDVAIELGVPQERINILVAKQRASQLGCKSEGVYSLEKVGRTSRIALEAAVRHAARPKDDPAHLEVPIAATYKLAEVAAAYEELKKRRAHGKIVLLM